MAKDCSNCEAARAFDVHKEGSRSGHEGLIGLDLEWRAAVDPYLEFVPTGLGLRGWIEEINGENLEDRSQHFGDDMGAIVMPELVACWIW